MNTNNQINRRTSLALGHVVGNRNQLQNKKLEDIREDWENGDPKLLNEIRYFGKSLDGSPQFFYTKSQESLVSLLNEFWIYLKLFINSFSFFVVPNQVFENA